MTGREDPEQHAKRSGTGWRAPRSGGYSARPGEKSPPPTGPGAASDPAPPEPAPDLVARIGRRLHAIAIKADCPYWQDIADAANALLGLEPDPGSPWDGRPLGEPPELRDLPPEVVALVHAVDRLRSGWAEADEERKAWLWRQVHEACDAVWGRGDSPPAEPDTALRERIAAAARELHAWNVKGREHCPRFVIQDTGEEDGYEAIAWVVLSAAPPDRDHSYMDRETAYLWMAAECAQLSTRLTDAGFGEAAAIVDAEVDRYREIAAAINAAAPPERGPAWAADGSRDSVWVIGERVVQRGPDQTVLLDGERVEYPLALATALRCATHSSDYWDQLAEREAPTPASVRAAALRRIEQREATPGNPADGPYPASVGEVADELAGLVVELDAGPARGLVRELVARLTEREAPSRDPGMFEAQLRKLIADTVRDLPALRAQKPYSQMLDHSARATDQIVDGVRRLMDGEQLFPVSSGISVEGGQR
jgi:hypothetical protein